MAAGLIEIYAQLSVRMPDDPKVRSLAKFGRGARACRDLYVQMILYSKAVLSDGFVPDEQLGVLVYPDAPLIGARDAERLAEVGLIRRGERGWQILAFLKRNKSRAQVEAESQSRTATARRANHERWHRDEPRPDCEFCDPSTIPRPSSDDPTHDPPTIPPIIVRRQRSESTETETETETETTTGLYESVGARGRAAPTRGRRLPDGFEPTTDMIDWAREHAPTVGRADHEAFCDYWRAQPGQRGVKVDWPATWRNWMRREQQKRSNGGLGVPGQARASTSDQRVQAGLELAAELRADERRELAG